MSGQVPVTLTSVGILQKEYTVINLQPSLLSQLERLTKQMREAEQRLKAIPLFCFPDAKDWSPVSEYSR